MTWRVVIPFKPAGERKSRLAGRLEPAAREALAMVMLTQVAAAVRGEAAVTLLCAEPPPGWAGAWLRDRDRGLNAELAGARNGDASAFAVIHADLPLVGPEDVRALLAAADGGGMAIAPDRHDAGTNALAVTSGTPVDFVFGEGSFARFRTQRDGLAIVRRPGLALDVDVAADLDAATAMGFPWPSASR